MFAARGSISVAGDMLQCVSHVKVLMNRNSCEMVILLEYIYIYKKIFHVFPVFSGGPNCLFLNSYLITVNGLPSCFMIFLRCGY
jgi:hypothetical protein